jgi:SAM-dependent methyltransferase
MASDSTKPRTAYQFGDTDLAAGRLRRLAEVFEPSSRVFLRSLAQRSPRDVVDLGCGPGHSTRVVADVFPEADVLGLDSSARFVELARRMPTERVRYDVADAARALPAGPYDLAYCRYLLTHLSHPERAIDCWSRQLRPGGIVAIEENDWIRTRQPAFARYLSIVEAMLADAGGQLYVGAHLERVGSWPLLTRQASRVVPIEVADRAAAGMFLPNLATWRERPLVKEHYSTGELDRLHDDLLRLNADDSGRRSITFGLRQMVLARRAT